jgi:NAD(P)-dependent dehydrogenase (short-subunit alcohol dehydrogenase family)
MKTVFITGADRGCGFCLAENFLEAGWKTYAGQFMPDWTFLSELKKKYPDLLTIVPLNVADTDSVRNAGKIAAETTDHIDILVNVAGIGGRSDDRNTMMKVMNTNTIGALRMVNEFLPLMQSGMKRICVFSSEAGSVTMQHRTDSFGYCMSKTALNMELKLLFNRLNPKGFSFRIYHPGWVRSYMMGSKSTVGNFEPEESSKVAFGQFTENRENENVLLMTDVSGHTWPF